MLGALLDLGADQKFFKEKIAALKLPVEIHIQETQRASLRATKVDVKVLHGKFFALSVDDGGKLSVEVVTKAVRKANGNGQTKANGNGHYEYFLADGRGGFEDIQKAMDALGITEANRPKHNRYDRLSADWQKKIIRKAKDSQPEAIQPEPEAKASQPAKS